MSRCVPGDERASVVPLVAVVLFVTASLLVAVNRMGTTVVDRARADAYADSTALATAGGGDEVGISVMAANGAEMVAIERADDGTVRVTIEHRGHESTAAARVGELP